MKQREFIKGCHIKLKLEEGRVIGAKLKNKEYFWEVPEHLIGCLKKDDLAIVTVNKTIKGLSKSIILVKDVLNELEEVDNKNLRFVERKYTHKKGRFIKKYLGINKNKEELTKNNQDTKNIKVKTIESEKISKETKEESLAMILANKCNLSERSITSLLKKYDEEKVKRAVDMYLATEDRKAPLKFLKFILEKIS